MGLIGVFGCYFAYRSLFTSASVSAPQGVFDTSIQTAHAAFKPTIPAIQSLVNTNAEARSLHSKASTQTTHNQVSPSPETVAPDWVNDDQLSNRQFNDQLNQTDISTDVSTQPVHLEIHLSRYEVVLYKGKTEAKRYPIAIGRQGWETPMGTFQIMDMRYNPIWINPFTDEAIPGGSPANPLGHYWIGFWTNGKNWIGFHGTPNPETVGRSASHGCVRMHNEDVEELFHQVSLGTPVIVKP